MKGDVGELGTTDFEAFHEFAREVGTCGRQYYCAFVFGEDALVAFYIVGFGFALDVRGKWCVAEGEEVAFEFIVCAIVEEADGAST